MKQTFISLILGLSGSLMVSAASLPSILELRHSITDDNIIAPESFETQTRLLEENFYLKNYVVPGIDTGNSTTATAAEYEQRLAKLPTVIDLPYNSIVGNYIDMYLTRKRGLVADMLALHNYYGRFFEEELLKEGMPLELEYLPVIESAINPNAMSRAGAVGLWQFMPATAKGLGMEINSLVDERRDPRISSRNAARYLKQLHDIYNDWSLAIAAYNCGPGNVNKALRRASGDSEEIKDEKKDFWEIYNYLPAETRGYVPAFIAANYVMNYYRQHGISPTIVKRHLTTDTVRIDKNVHFNQIASVLNIPVEEIRMLNPQFLKDQIPGAYRPYYLTLPTQQCLSYIMSEKRILDYDKDLYARRTTAEPGGSSGESSIITSDGGKANLANASRQSDNAETNHEIATQATERTVTKIHEVQRGENLRDIAKMYAVSATDIKRWNKLRAGKVKEGDRLTIEVVEHITPDEVRVVAVPEVAQVFPKDNTDTSAEAKADTKTETTETKAAPAKPKENTQRTKATHTTTHKVKKGDTLDRIARKYGTTVAAIQAANGMQKNNTRIQIGQSLKIPAKGSAASTTRKSTAKKSTKRKAARPRK
ncbi:transglycosylase SLT domain-containing protein [Duncaniella muricolitica]|jgi:membrane-bound lytic murein transglycosylase D|uniref:transglycosylase SLT domain-containing protein n=1 Tax=Duncaniella muricolitica TaxID=2880704 RepID=UPI00244E37E6|nr:transglycosylase SLT domain-containing protein [Duncaniella muricolitica]